MAKSKGIGLSNVPTVDKAYQARDDMETLRRAEEIKMDSTRHGAAKQMAKMHIKTMMNITGKKK